MIIIKIKTENSAFTNYRGSEVARILRELAERYEQGGIPDTLYDINGNKVCFITDSG